MLYSDRNFYVDLFQTAICILIVILDSNADVNAASGPDESKPKVDPGNVLQFRGYWIASSYSENIPIRRSPFSTFGMVFPLPKIWISTEAFYRVNTKSLNIILTGVSNYILEAAVMRHLKIIRDKSGLSTYSQRWKHQAHVLKDLANYDDDNGKPGTAGTDSWNAEIPSIKWNPSLPENVIRQVPSEAVRSLKQHEILLHVQSNGNSWPSLNMNEAYNISVDQRGIFIIAKETWGALRALQSLTQMMWTDLDRIEVYINRTYIEDEPRFKHRGMMVDTSRHFIDKSVLLKNLEAMAFNKFNVFHWHIVDDHSFPYESLRFPNLSRLGAFSPESVYKRNDIKEVIKFAQMRGIRVIPEFDVPGHTNILGRIVPHLLSKCLFDSTLYYGPLNPVKNSTFEFIRDLLDEAFDLFMDEYTHLGGDEVDPLCWTMDEELRKLTVNGTGNLYAIFWNNVQNILTKLGEKNDQKRRKMIAWQDVLSDAVVAKNNLIHVWKTPVDPIVTLGYNVVYSTCWYLDHFEHIEDWTSYYTCDPTKTLSSKQVSNVIGGEVCMWTEYQTDDTILQKIWPLSSAVAERLWSPEIVASPITVGARLQEQECRMSYQGIPVGNILGPGFCHPKRKVYRSQETQYRELFILHHFSEFILIVLFIASILLIIKLINNRRQKFKLMLLLIFYIFLAWNFRNQFF